MGTGGVQPTGGLLMNGPSMGSSSRLKPARVLAGAVLVLIAASAASAELLVFRDSVGRATVFDSEDPYHPFRMPLEETATRLDSSGITFSVAYMDVVSGTGAGFDDPTRGAIRRATVDAILAYLDSVLNESGAVQIRFSISASVGGGLAGGGTTFGATPGFHPGQALQHITTGIDPNGSATPEIIVQVDFSHNWNDDLGAPASDEFDLFSVLLHELTHGLGFQSLVNSQGVNPIRPGVYSIWDSLIEYDDGTTSRDLWALVGGAPQFLGTPADLVSGHLVFTGTNAAAAFGSNPPLGSLSGFPFIDLSHWKPGFPIVAVMEGSASPGEMVRQYATVDAGALMDIGYGNIQPANAPPELSCSDPTVSADPLQCSAAATCGTIASCSDPDGDDVTLDCAPAAPYPLGETVVTVTCNDGTESTVGGCRVTVEDSEPPEIACPSDITVQCDESPAPANTGDPMVGDNCDVDPVASFSDDVTPGSCVGESQIARLWVVADTAGNSNSCIQTVSIVDTTPPSIQCNAPTTMTPRDAPIAVVATQIDNCDAQAAIEIVGFDCFAYTGSGRRVDKKESCIVEVIGDTVIIVDSGGVGTTITWTVAATDSCGNTTETVCEVPFVHPVRGI